MREGKPPQHSSAANSIRGIALAPRGNHPVGWTGEVSRPIRRGIEEIPELVLPLKPVKHLGVAPSLPVVRGDESGASLARIVAIEFAVRTSGCDERAELLARLGCW